MLRTRVITAVILAAVFLSALFWLPPPGWLAFVTCIAGVAAWEWGALMQLGQRTRLLLAVLLIASCALLALLMPATLGLSGELGNSGRQLGAFFYLPAAIFWLAIAPFWLVRRWSLANRFAGLGIGSVLLLPTWLALVQLRQAGPLALLGVMAFVWLADIGAYFAGRRFGKHKLAPNISPGKTWEGAIGGGLAGVVFCWLVAWKLPALPADSVLMWTAIGVLFAAFSVMGDLFESLLKRQAGLKDSSNILPGHGGLLDRIDSLTSTLPLAAMVWLLWQR